MIALHKLTKNTLDIVIYVVYYFVHFIFLFVTLQFHAHVNIKLMIPSVTIVKPCCYLYAFNYFVCQNKPKKKKSKPMLKLDYKNLIFNISAPVFMFVLPRFRVDQKQSL